MSDVPAVKASAGGSVSGLRTAYEVAAEVVQSNPAIETVTFVAYNEGPNWRDTAPVGQDPDIAFLASGMKQDFGERVLFKFSRKEASAANIRKCATSLSRGKLLALISKVNLSNGMVAHIPMMDFLCLPSSQNRCILRDLLRELRHGKGVLLESGRSYHYYGFRLLTDEEWRVFLGKCLLMSGFADDRYVGHQLADGHCVLRLSAGQRKSVVPHVVAEI